MTCSFEGCGGKIRARKLCGGHLSQLYKGWDLRPLGHSRRPKPKGDPVQHTGRDGVTAFALRFAHPGEGAQVLRETLGGPEVVSGPDWKRATPEWFVINHNTGELTACRNWREAHGLREQLLSGQG